MPQSETKNAPIWGKSETKNAPSETKNARIIFTTLFGIFFGKCKNMFIFVDCCVIMKSCFIFLTLL